MERQPATTMATQRAAADLRQIAIRALQRMVLSDQHCFGFCIRRGPGGDVLEGVSMRYTAIAVLGLVSESKDVVGSILGRHTLSTVCDTLVDHASRATDVGEVGLTLWAARQIGHAGVDAVLERLRALDPIHGTHPTVELSWCLTALALGSDAPGDPGLRDQLTARLLQTCHPATHVFHHWAAGSRAPWWRAHVTCFADFVYPIQALSHVYMATGDETAITAARRCADRMCELQGAAGQWWWHFDVRTGRVIERFPVYAIHQDAMGPMALFDLHTACGDDHGAAIDRSMAWLLRAPELADGSLVDREADVIWRKVARREPGKLSRSVQALASRVHPALRCPGVGSCLPPGRIDFETRPYHMGWLLYAWRPERVKAEGGGGDAQAR